jgi:5-methylcytosine-specific restriction endonuclease McrA
VSTRKKTVRRALRTLLRERDGLRCVACDAACADPDPHHITPREALPGGGYVPANVISLCPACHAAAEEGRLTADHLYTLIGSSRALALAQSEAAAS